jgi:hypothetical protein
MALQELTPESTKEEVTSYVDEVVKEVEAERTGEKDTKDDARLAVEHADNEHKPKPEGAKAENTAASEDEGEDSAKADKSGEESWVTEDLKAEAAAYGIKDSELTEFASREEFERALRLFDKSALEAGRKALAESDKTPTRNEKGQFEKREPAADPKPSEGKKDGAYEVKLDRTKWDDEIVNELEAIRDHYESRFEAMESQFAAIDARAEEQHFDGLVDALGHTDLFGKSGHENTKELQRRRDLHVAVKAQMLGMAQLGRPTELSESLVSRVARMVFGEELGKKDLKNLTRKITKQSNGRQGGGATRPQDPREDPRDAADRLYKEMSGA